MFTRTRYQNGSLRVKSREKGLRVWEFRYYEPCQDGTRRGLRAVTVGTLQEFPSEAAARKSSAVQAIVLRINAEHPLGPVTASTMGALIARYEKEEMPTRYSTRVSYQSFIDRYIRPRWAETPITGVKPIAAEAWLTRLKLAPKTRGHIKGLMSCDVQVCPTLGTGSEQPDAVSPGKRRQQATHTTICAHSRRVSQTTAARQGPLPDHGPDRGLSGTASG